MLSKLPHSLDLFGGYVGPGLFVCGYVTMNPWSTSPSAFNHLSSIGLFYDDIIVLENGYIWGDYDNKTVKMDKTRVDRTRIRNEIVSPRVFSAPVNY